MKIHNAKHISEYLNENIINLNDVIIFTNSKSTYWEHPLNINDLPYNLGLECTNKTNLVAIDVDHLHEHKDAQDTFNTLRDKYFNGAIPSFNVNPNKYKLVFKITDNQEPLTEYNIKDGIDVVGYNDKAIEFFGAKFKHQCIKVHGRYKSVNTYTDKFSIIEITSNELKNFIDDVLATNLLTIRSHGNKTKHKIKNPEELKKAYNKVPDTIKNHLNNIADAVAGQSDFEYMSNRYLYVKECIEHNFSLQECCYFMEQALTIRGIDKSKLKSFIKFATVEYDKAKYFTKKQFNHDVLAEELIKDYQLRKYNNNIYYWNNNLYHSDFDKFLTGVIQNKLPSLKKNQKQEVIYHINYANSVIDIKHADVNYIQFANGVLNIDTGELLPPSPDVFITNIIPHNYNPNAYDKIVDESLKQWACGDDSIHQLLIECAGYCLYRSCKFKKAFIFYGEKNNGKSSYIDLLVNMLGQNNTTSHDLKDLTNQFYRVTLKDKLANIGDDIQKSYTDSSDFKKIVSGDMISAKSSHKDPIDFKPYSKLIFSCNDIPKLTDNTGAVHNRLILIPFNADFTENANKGLRSHLKTEQAIEYFIVLAVKGLMQLLKNDGFTPSDAVEREREQYRIDNNSILSFIKEREDIDSEHPIFKRDTVDNCYNLYKTYCDENNLKPFGKNIFSRKVCNELGLKVQRKMVLRHQERYFIDK